VLLTISPASHVSMVICRSDSLKTATAANVYAYEIALEQNKITGSTTETSSTKNESDKTPASITKPERTNVVYDRDGSLKSLPESQPSKALLNYGGFDLRHSCYLSILV